MQTFRRGPVDPGTMDRPGGVLAVAGGLLLARLGRREHRVAGALVAATGAALELSQPRRSRAGV